MLLLLLLPFVTDDNYADNRHAERALVFL